MYLQLSFHLQCAYLVSDAEARLKGKKKERGRKGKMKKERTTLVEDATKGISHSLKG